MKSLVKPLLFTIPLLAGPALAGVPVPSSKTRVTTSEAAVLRGMEDPSLLALRAGAVASSAPLGAEERASLRAAEARTPNLGELRAGDITLSDRDLTIIAIIVGVILLIVIIA